MKFDDVDVDLRLVRKKREEKTFRKKVSNKLAVVE